MRFRHINELLHQSFPLSVTVYKLSALTGRLCGLFLTPDSSLWPLHICITLRSFPSPLSSMVRALFILLMMLVASPDMFLSFASWWSCLIRGTGVFFWLRMTLGSARAQDITATHTRTRTKNLIAPANDRSLLIWLRVFDPIWNVHQSVAGELWVIIVSMMKDMIREPKWEATSAPTPPPNETEPPRRLRRLSTVALTTGLCFGLASSSPFPIPVWARKPLGKRGIPGPTSSEPERRKNGDNEVRSERIWRSDGDYVVSVWCTWTGSGLDACGLTIYGSILVSMGFPHFINVTRDKIVSVIEWNLKYSSFMQSILY